MTTTIDLTPLGFTSTESRVYNSLLDLGPSSGYALARELGVARANTYHALASLRAKGAISVLNEHPLLVRAIRPDGLVTLIGAQYSERLTALEEQVRRRGQTGGGEMVVALSSERALLETATRMIVRELGALLTVAPARLFTLTGPAWRKRKADGHPAQCWSYGDGETTAPIPAQPLRGETVVERVGPGVVLMAADSSAVWATWDRSGTAGWWSQEPLSTRLVRLSIANIVGA